MSWPTDRRVSHYDTRGTHLCSPGPYQASIQRLLNKYPNLRFDELTENEARASNLIEPEARAVALHLPPGQDAIREDLTGVTALRQYLQRHGDLQESSKRRTILLVEDYHPDCMGIIGEHFGIDPQILMKHRRSAFFESYHHSGNTASLASAVDNKKSFSLLYIELRHLKHSAQKHPISRVNAHRGMRTCRVPGGDFAKVGRQAFKATYWSRENKAGYWDGPLKLSFLRPSKVGMQC